MAVLLVPPALQKADAEKKKKKRAQTESTKLLEDYEDFFFLDFSTVVGRVLDLS